MDRCRHARPRRPRPQRDVLTVSALEWTDRAEIVYNFGVDEFHTYFVGESGAWVHNCEKLSRFIVDKMKAAGFDPHEIKKEVISKNAKVSRYDLFVRESGDIVVKPKSGAGLGEPTGLNVKMFED